MKKELLASMISVSIVLTASNFTAFATSDVAFTNSETQDISVETMNDLVNTTDELTDGIESDSSDLSKDVLEEQINENIDISWYQSEQNEFILYTAAQLRGLAKLVNDGTSDFKGKTIKIGDDINLNWEEWTPIGGAGTGKKFAGIFDGDNHVISNLKITKDTTNKAENNSVGFFGTCTNTSKLQNFTLKNVDIIGSLYIAAVLGGSEGAEAKVDNVHVIGSIKLYGWWYVGGILGKGYSTVTDCSIEGDGIDTSYVSISGGYVGGIVGFMGEDNCQTNSCEVKNITVKGAHNGIGGINGILHYGNTISGCVAENIVVWQYTNPDEDDGRIYTGAFAGTYLDNGGKNPPTLKDCEFTGEIYSGADKNDVLEENRYVGSLWYGAEPPANVNIENCKINMPPVIAQIGDVTYKSLKEAIDAAQQNDTLEILTDVTITQELVIDKDITVIGFSKISVSDTGSLKISAGKYDADPSTYLQEGYKADLIDEFYVVSKMQSQPSTGGSSSSSGSSGDKIEITQNSDGSTTITVTRPDGSTTETTKHENGYKEIVNTDKNGNKTTTITDTEGNKTEKVENTDGSVETTVNNNDGSSSKTTIDKNGNMESTVNLSDKTISSASENNEAVKLPMPEVSAAIDQTNAPTVTVNMPSDSVKVEIPVYGVTFSTVAVIVREDGTEEIIKTSLPTENGVLVTLNNGDTIKIIDNSRDFIDVSNDHWGNDGINFSTSRELFNGTSETTFSPEQNMSRAMIWTVLARLDSVDTEQSNDIWYQVGLDWAIASGVSDGSNPNSTMTREQLVTMLYRYSGNTSVYGELTGYTDISNINYYALDAMTWAVNVGLIFGMGDGSLNPQGTATRAEVATILMRFCENIAN